MLVTRTRPPGHGRRTARPAPRPSESHLACHTYPEFGVATFNLYCCRARPEWPWRGRLREALGATQVTVRALPRGGGEP